MLKKKIFFYLYVITITFRALEEFVKEKLPAFGDEKRDYILIVPNLAGVILGTLTFLTSF
jgi:hypothetical protein